MIEVVPSDVVTYVFTNISHLHNNTDDTTPGNRGLLSKECLKNFTNSVTISYSLLCDLNTVQPLPLVKGAEHLSISCW